MFGVTNKVWCMWLRYIWCR